MTEKMSSILPDIPNAPSGWNTDNHYFYEIVNRNGNDIRIQLSLSSRNASENFMTMANRINDVVSTKQAKENWQWWIIFKTSKIQIPGDLNKEAIFAGLDNALEEIKTFEDDLLTKLNQ